MMLLKWIIEMVLHEILESYKIRRITGVVKVTEVIREVKMA